MAINLNDNIKVFAGKPIDNRYLASTNAPYTSISNVNSTIYISERYVGLTVNINGVEYWYKDGVSDIDLIEKIYNTEIPITDFITGGTNLGYFSGYTGIQILPITHISDSNCDGYYYSLYNYYYRGSDGFIHIGTPTDNIPKRAYVKTSGYVKSWIWNEYSGGSDQLGWILVDGNVSEQIGTFQYSSVPLYYATGSSYTISGWTSGSDYNNGSDLVISTVLGSLTTGNTITIGGRPFAYASNNNMYFRSLYTKTPDKISISDDETFIYISGATVNGTNVGTGMGIYSGYTGNTLLFKTLIGSGNTIISQIGDDVVVYSEGISTNYVQNAINGIHLVSGDTTVSLGGVLTGNTIFDGGVNKYNLQYGGNYHSNYNDRSLIDKQYVDDNYLNLSQSTPQSVSGSPIFNTIQFNPTPTVGAFSNGKMFYDVNHGTVAINLDNDITLQLGQETQLYVYNNTGNQINNGSAVYISGAYGNYATIALAKANSLATSNVFGVATQDIPHGSMGYVTISGELHDINTSAWSPNTKLYLSEITAGALTATPPPAPYPNNEIATVITSHATNGIILVSIQLSQSLSSLNDVGITSPQVDEVLKYNGVEWINGSSITVNAGAGVNFYLNDTTLIPTGTSNNRLVKKLDKEPQLISEQTVTIPATVALSPMFGRGFYYNSALSGTQLDAGTWKFYTFASVNDVSGGRISSITTSIFRIISETVSGTTTGSGTTRTFLVSSGNPFVSGDTNANYSLSSGIQTPQGVYRINSYINPNQVTINTPATYVNETNVAFKKWKFLFTGNTGTITSIYPNHTLYTTQVVTPAYPINSTDRLGIIYFAVVNNTTNVYFTYGGSTRYSYFSTPLYTRHNDLAGLQGGSTTERYHLTNSEYVGTGTGNFVRETSPQLITPNIGNAIGTTLQLAGQLTSDVTGSTAPFVINSTGLTTNLNADLLDGLHANQIVGGDNTQVQFNNNGTLDGHSGFTYNYTGETVSIGTIDIKSGLASNCNHFIGYKAGVSNTLGCNNTGVGYMSLYSNAIGESNTAIGISALYSNTTGCYNFAGGSNSLYYNNGDANVGIGEGTLYQNTIGNYNTAVGQGAMASNISGSSNVALGATALLSNTCGHQNVAIGNYALQNNTKGCYNIGIGSGAQNSNTLGNYNVAIGVSSLYCNSTSSDNIAIGYESLYYNTTGLANIGIGRNALYKNTVGNNNVAIGCYALYSNTGGTYNVSIGFKSSQQNTCGCSNVATGYYSLYSNTKGCNNTAVGSEALYANTCGCFNTANGSQALKCNSTGANNVAIGYSALLCNTTASYNTVIGLCAMFANCTGCNNVAIGSYAMRCNTTGYNNISIGVCALGCNTIGAENVGIGLYALNCNVNGIYNTAVGVCSLRCNTSGIQNVAIGFYSLHFNNGCSNVGVGTFTLNCNTSGLMNTAIGSSALSGNVCGCYNTAVGRLASTSNNVGCNNSTLGVCALHSNTSGHTNVAVGYNAGLFQCDGTTPLTLVNDSVFIGGCSKGNTNGDCNSIVIGYCSVGAGSNTTVIGNTGTTDARIYGNGIITNDLTYELRHSYVDDSSTGITMNLTCNTYSAVPISSFNYKRSNLVTLSANTFTIQTKGNYILNFGSSIKSLSLIESPTTVHVLDFRFKCNGSVVWSAKASTIGSEYYSSFFTKKYLRDLCVGDSISIDMTNKTVSTCSLLINPLAYLRKENNFCDALI